LNIEEVEEERARNRSVIFHLFARLTKRTKSRML